MRHFMLLLFFSPIVFAATVELDNGRIYSAEILSQDDRFYTFRINGNLAQIPRDRVVNVSEEEKVTPSKKVNAGISIIEPATSAVVMQGVINLPPVPSRTALNPQAEQPVNVTYAAEPPIARMPLPENPAELQRLRTAVDSLRSRFPDQRLQAEETLAATGESGLAALSVFGLYHASPDVRTRSVQLLSNLGGRGALKALLEAFHAAARPTIPPYQVAYVRTLADEISALTGQALRFEPRQGTMGPQMAARAVQWWRQNFDQMPPQIGEPRLDSTDPNYGAKLRSLRQLVLESREFGGSSYPPELVGPAVPPTPAERTLLETVPTVPREAVFHRDVQPSGAPGFDKIPGPESTQPGLNRARDYADRLRETR